MEIIHQIQPTATSCASTCIAMLLNVPAEEIIEQFHDQYKAGEINVDQFLLNKGLTVESLLSSYWQCQWDGIYIAAVPSLNIKANLHQIIIDTRNNKVTIYDPNMGKPGKNYYVHDDKEDKTEFEYGLISYCLEFKIHP